MMRIRISGKNPNHKSDQKKERVISIKNDEKILLQRHYRLGDLIMLEPVARYFFEQGFKPVVATLPEYKPVLDCAIPPIGFEEHDNFPVHDFSKIFLLNKIHNNGRQGIVTKIDSFFAMCDIDPTCLTLEQKRPKLECLPQIRDLALEDLKLSGRTVLVSTESFKSTSPRSIQQIFFLVFLKNFKISISSSSVVILLKLRRHQMSQIGLETLLHLNN